MEGNKYKNYPDWFETIIQQCCNDKNFRGEQILADNDRKIYEHFVLDNDLHVYYSHEHDGSGSEIETYIFDGESLLKYENAGKTQRCIHLSEYVEKDFYNFQLEFVVGDVRSGDNVPGYIAYQDDNEFRVAFLPDKAGRNHESGQEVYFEDQFDLSMDIKDKLERAIEETEDPELQATYQRALGFYSKISELVKTQNKHMESELVATILEDPDRMDEIFRSTDDLDALYVALESELLPDGIVFDDAEMYHNSVISEALEKLSRDYLYEEPPYGDLDLEAETETEFDFLSEAEEELEEFYAEHPEFDNRPDSQIPEGMSIDEFSEAMGASINEFGEIIRPAGQDSTKSDIPPELLAWLNEESTPLKKREEQLVALEEEAKTISEAEALISKQNQKAGEQK